MALAREPLPDGLVEGAVGCPRCWWPGAHADYLEYHDREWGRPQGNRLRLFEKLCLEGFQSGLSWLTILRKRENFRRAFAGFEPEAVARFDDADRARLLSDAGIVRHAKKIEATINNARATLDLEQAEGVSLAAILWRFEPGPRDHPITYDHVGRLGATPASTEMANYLKSKGFRFFGPTTAYALMQSAGMVDDHLEGCFVRDEVEAERTAFERPQD